MVDIYYFSNDWIMNAGIFLFFIVFTILSVFLTVFIISLFRKDSYDKKFAPNISIIIPVYNEEKHISACLDAVIASDYDMGKIEVICVDDGSTDSSSSIIKDYMKKHGFIHYIKGAHQGKTSALNLGLKKAKHDHVLTIDADVLVSKDFVKMIIRPLSSKNIGVVNGVMLIHKPKSFFDEFQNVEYYYNSLIRISFSKVFNNSIWFFGAAACYKKDFLKRVGGFSKKTMSEDVEVSLSIFKKGYDIITYDKAVHHTFSCTSFREFFIQRTRWYFGGLQCAVFNFNVLKRKSFPIYFWFFSQLFWTLFAFVSIPLIIYQVNYWMPKGFVDIFVYLFRWFTLIGPFYVIYKIPVWGLSLISVFGVLSGVISFFVNIFTLIFFKAKIRFKTLFVLFLYFPYTIVINIVWLLAIIRGLFSKKKHFIK